MMQLPSPEESFYSSAQFRTGAPLPSEHWDAQHRAEEKSAALLAEYQRLGSFDTYFAASCRTLDDFQRMNDVLLGLCEETRKLLGRDLVVSAPLLLTMDNNQRKGRFERWCVEHSKTLFLYDGGRDTYGKDMEDACARLLFQSPVVRYIQDATRHHFQKTVHPLSLIGDSVEGWGVHAVQTIPQAAQCLTSELTLPITERHVEHGWEVERCTHCASLVHERRLSYPLLP